MHPLNALTAQRHMRFVGLLIAAWTATAVTHELGHIAGGLCCGGTLRKSDLLPWHLPYSIFDPDPFPLVTLWCGPLLGVLIPLGFAFLMQRDWLWFIANFCMLANGAYLAGAWYSGDRFLDTPQLLAHGANAVSILAYCAFTITIGYMRFRRSCIRELSRGSAATLCK